jgi:hypothetical protein
VLPIASAGCCISAGGTVDADTFVLTLPMAHQQEALALLVFIGGLSAATGMVIVETIALSTMVCNDLVMPLLLRVRWLGLAEKADLSGLLLGSGAGRSPSSSAWATSTSASPARPTRWVDRPDQLRRRGPVRPGGDRRHVLARRHPRRRAGGPAAGFVFWAYTLLLPSFAKSGWLPEGFIEPTACSASNCCARSSSSA